MEELEYLPFVFVILGNFYITKMHLSTLSGFDGRKSRVETFPCCFLSLKRYSVRSFSVACKCIKTWIRCCCGLESVLMFLKRQVDYV